MRFQLPDITHIRSKVDELNVELTKDSVFKDQALLSKLSKEHQRLSRICELVDEFDCKENELRDLCSILDDKSTDSEFLELAASEKPIVEEKLEQLHEAVMLAMVPPDPSDSKNIIIEIRAGTGGDEASLFACDLYRMYIRFAEKKGWKVELMGSHPSESGGFKEISILISGENVYKSLKFEGGGHRVQRIPTTESNGRIHTSSATVAVLPEAQEVDISISHEELEISICRASGPGGQGVNTTDSAVQILHKPSGIIVTCADERSQQKNRQKAMQVLRARLLRQKEEEEHKKYAETRKQQIGSGDRSDRIRTYNFTQNRVTDHRIGLTTYNITQVLDGDLDEFIEALELDDKKHRAESI